MSHITRLKTIIKDVDCLLKTFEYLKIPFIYNVNNTFYLAIQKSMFGGNHDATISVRRSNESEPFMFLFDDLSRPAVQLVINRIKNKATADANPVEKFLEIIQQRYAVEEFIKTAKKQNHEVTVLEDKNGSYEIEVTVPDREIQV